MDEDDFRALIPIVQANLRDIGAPDLADEVNYVIRDPETGETRLLPASERLIEMLRAFERYMAVRDFATYDDAMERIRRSVEGREPEGVVVLPSPEDENNVQVDLSQAPRLTEFRVAVSELVDSLTESIGYNPPRRGPLI